MIQTGPSTLVQWGKKCVVLCILVPRPTNNISVPNSAQIQLSYLQLSLTKLVECVTWYSPKMVKTLLCWFVPEDQPNTVTLVFAVLLKLRRYMHASVQLALLVICCRPRLVSHARILACLFQSPHERPNEIYLQNLFRDECNFSRRI